MRTKKTILFVLIVLAMSSCKKDNPIAPGPVDEHNFVQLTNLKIDPAIVEKSVGAKTDPLGLWYYSLDDQKVVLADQARTDQWDFAFDCNRNMILVNNGKYKSNKVIYENGGKALFTISAKLFEEVKEAPADDAVYNKTINYSGEYGADSYALNGDLDPNILGWVQSFEDGVLLKYVKAIKNRTIIFKTNKGKYAKLQIQSVYKDNPAKPTENSEKYYLNFRFFLQKDGSRNLNSAK
ncbi:HmuY family protein [Pedobacter caeni]|uniref:HmuY protein n=1 Tax=Pedobacter caeni TaxID=288992 RepID=A0A1M5JT26_9SPHI|nr:HmuY family protein [Pedobacter caeni]SHG43772.1 HmuY protein [Pedobacter caeni]